MARRGRQFSLRTVFVVMALIGGLLAAWRALRPSAIADVTAYTGRAAQTAAPFLLHADSSDNVTVRRDYYVWLGGAVFRAPFHRSFPEPNPVILGGVQPRIIIHEEPEFEQLFDSAGQ